MAVNLEVCLSPADYPTRATPGLAEAVCVVFDVLRATSVIVTGLANGATGFVPVVGIPEALAARVMHPGALLAGERDGQRISAQLTGGVEFDLGNSPREYTGARIAGRTIITTTTNGTRALQSCATARSVVAASFLNLKATARWLGQASADRIVLVCAGTADAPALEDILGAGALCEALIAGRCSPQLCDSAETARRAYREAREELFTAISRSQNGRRLLADERLRDDVAFCLQRDAYELVAVRGADGVIRPAS